MPAQVSANLVNRRVRNNRIEFGKIFRLVVIRFSCGRPTQSGQVLSQREMRQHPFHPRHIGWMVQVLRIALLSHSERGLGQPRLNRQHRSRILRGLRVVLPGKRKHLANVIDILLAQLYALGVGARVVIALRQSKPTGTKNADHLRRICEILP